MDCKNIGKKKYVCVVDQAGGQDGWILANKTQKKKEQGPAITTEQARSKRDLLYDQRNSLLREQSGQSRA